MKHIIWFNVGIQKGWTRKLTKKDFAVLCSNCHRMIHKLKDSSDLEQLKNLIKKEVSRGFHVEINVL